MHLERELILNELFAEYIDDRILEISQCLMQL